jgi:hypothetical protein
MAWRLALSGYAIIKAFSRRGREISWLIYMLAVVLVLYCVFVRRQIGNIDSEGRLILRRLRCNQLRRVTSKYPICGSAFRSTDWNGEITAFGSSRINSEILSLGTTRASSAPRFHS